MESDQDYVSRLRRRKPRPDPKIKKKRKLRDERYEDTHKRIVLESAVAERWERLATELRVSDSDLAFILMERVCGSSPVLPPASAGVVLHNVTKKIKRKHLCRICNAILERTKKRRRDTAASSLVKSWYPGRQSQSSEKLDDERDMAAASLVRTWYPGGQSQSSETLDDEGESSRDDCGDDGWVDGGGQPNGEMATSQVSTRRRPLGSGSTSGETQESEGPHSISGNEIQMPPQKVRVIVKQTPEDDALSQETNRTLPPYSARHSEVYAPGSFPCYMCQKEFNSMSEVQNHQCIDDMRLSGQTVLMSPLRPIETEKGTYHVVEKLIKQEPPDVDVEDDGRTSDCHQSVSFLCTSSISTVSSKPSSSSYQSVPNLSTSSASSKLPLSDAASATSTTPGTSLPERISLETYHVKQETSGKDDSV